MRKTLFSLLNIDCWSTVTRISGPIAKTAVRMRRHRCQKRVLLIEICIMFPRAISQRERDLLWLPIHWEILQENVIKTEISKESVCNIQEKTLGS